MPPRKDYKNLLLQQAITDKAENLSINNIDINRCENIKREMRINFKCICGNLDNKNIRMVLESSGLFCNKCTIKNSLDKKKETCLEIFGVENPFQSESVKNEIKAVFKKKFGVEYVTQLESVKDKAKQTCIEKFGVEYASQSEIVKDKIKTTNIKNLGVEYPSQSESVRNKCKSTYIKNLGVEHPSKSEIIKDKKKKTSMKNYGVEHPMQDKETFEKCQKSSFKQKLYKFKSGEEDNCQGYEPLALEELEELHNYTYKDYKNWNNLEFYYEINNKKHRYYPDIPFIRMNKIIEVKSDYIFYKELYKNLKKAECVIKQGFDFEFWIYDSKFNKLILDNKTIELKQELHKELL